MRRSDPFRFAALTLITGMFAHGAVAEPVPQRYSAPIAITEAAPFVRLLLPPSVYARSLQADLRDLRVVDGRGERVPFAFLAAPAAPAASEQLRNAVLYPLPPRPAHGAWPSPVDVTVDGDRISVHRSEASLASSSAFAVLSPGWLIDLGETVPGEAPPRRLRLAWSGPTEFSVPYGLETSDDLRNWRAAQGGQLMALQSAAGSLTQPFIVLPQPVGRFLRLIWLDTTAVPVLSGATALAPAPGLVVASAASELVFAPSVEPAGRSAAASSRQALHFDLGGDLPLLDIDLRFAGGTRVVPARVEGRSRVDEPWRELGAGLFYRLERAGVIAESPALTAPTHARFIRVVGDERTAALVAKETQLVVHAQLASLVFATTGEPPFRLLAGSVDAAEGALPVSTLVPQLDQERQRFGRADIGVFSEDADAARAAERGERIARLRPWLLWSVLLAGVAGLGLLVWRLARTGAAPQVRKP
ncbi:MAG: DUF3999 family protein [Caldimonas sp.]